MTIEEWLNKRIEDAREDCLEQNIETYEDGYAEGYKDALQLVLDMLPMFEHEVTLREFKEFCKTHEQCSRCSVVDACRFDCPRIWDIKEMERRIKWQEERRKENNKNDDREISEEIRRGN